MFALSVVLSVRSTYTSSLTHLMYIAGDRIIRQGDVGDAFYMIQSGRAVVTQTTTFGTSAGTELARLGPGKPCTFTACMMSVYMAVQCVS